MLVGFEQQAADVRHELGEGLVAVVAAAEREWACAKADEPILGAPLAARDRDADNHVCLPRQTVDQRKVSGQQRHEERAAVSPAKTFQFLVELLFEGRMQARAAVGLRGRARAVGREVGVRRVAAQPRDPERLIFGPLRQLLGLPQTLGVIAELQRRVRLPRDAAAPGLVGGAESHPAALRPTIHPRRRDAWRARKDGALLRAGGRGSAAAERRRGRISGDTPPPANA